MFLGIDVSKTTLDVALFKDERKPRHKVFANTAAGHQQVLGWLSDNGAAQPVHACLEATGTYEAAALALHEAGHTVSMVNPARCTLRPDYPLTHQDRQGRCPNHGPVLPNGGRPFGHLPYRRSARSKRWCAGSTCLLEMQTTEKNRLAAGPASGEVSTSP